MPTRALLDELIQHLESQLRVAENAVSDKGGSRIVRVRGNLQQVSSFGKVRAGDEWIIAEDLCANDYRQVKSAQTFTERSNRHRESPSKLRVVHRERNSVNEVTASNLVKVDLDGKKVMDSPYEINPAGFRIHSAIHAGRENAKCVLHVHSPHGVAVSVQKGGLLPLSQQSIFVLPSLAYHDYEGVALRDDEKPRLVRDLGNKNFFMLHNHGLITVAENIPDAFLRLYTFENACAIQVRAQAGGGELIKVNPRIIETGEEQANDVTFGGGGSLAWPAYLRMLDRIDATYKQ